MNRTALSVVVVTAVVVGVVFGVNARHDIDISALFYDPRRHLFVLNAQPWVMRARDAARWLITLIVAPAFLAVLAKLLLPKRRMLMGARAALFLIATMALGPGILANVILKDHWGRVRPIDVTELGGSGRFTAWWDPRGDCQDNCSFVAGEPSGAFWTMAPAALAPPQWRLLAYGGAVAFGAAIGLLRIAGGGHFFTDVVFAGVFIYLLTYAAHGLLFRWHGMTDAAAEMALERAAEGIRAALSALAQRVGARKPS